MINLGDEVRDTVSGFCGIAISKHVYMQGCTRISVQPKVNKDGELPDIASFDEPQLEVVKAGKVRPVIMPTDSGGPERYMDEGKSTG